MKSDSSNSLALAAQSSFIARRVESSSTRIFAANRLGSVGNRNPLEDLELELNPLLRVQAAHGEPEVPELREPESARCDRRMDHLRVAPVRPADASAHGLADRDDVVAMPKRSALQSALHSDPCP